MGGAIKASRAASVAILVIVMGTGLALSSNSSADPAATDSCAVPNALLKAGETAAARAAYVRLLNSNPNEQCAVTSLKKVNTPAPDTQVETLCAEGAALEARDLKSDALSVYKMALHKDPKKQCALDGVRSTRPDQPDFISRALNWLGTAVPNALLAIGGAVLVVFVLLMLGHIPFLRGVVLRAWFVGRILRPRVSIEELKDDALDENTKVGGPVTARIKERLAAYKEEAQGDGAAKQSEYLLDYGTGVEEFADLVSGDSALKAAFDKASGVSPHTQAVGALVDLMYAALPIPRLNVSGVLNPTYKQVASVTIGLESDASQQAAITLTRRTESTPSGSDYLGLAEPAAVWVQYEVARAIRSAPVSSDEAESYAFVRVGLDRYLAGDESGARAAYAQAMAQYPNNWAARVNLAILEAHLKRDYDRAIGLLDDGLTELIAAEVVGG